jgi:hypothetical protein
MSFAAHILLDSIRGYQVEDGSAILPVNTTALGDVTVIVYHARSTFGGKVQGKVKKTNIYHYTSTTFEIVTTNVPLSNCLEICLKVESCTKDVGKGAAITF